MDLKTSIAPFGNNVSLNNNITNILIYFKNEFMNYSSCCLFINQLFVFLVSKILLREGCKKILVADSLSLLQKMHRTQMRGVRVDGGFTF